MLVGGKRLRFCRRAEVKKAAVAILTFATVAVYLETMDQSVLTALRPIVRFRLAGFFCGLVV